MKICIPHARLTDLKARERMVKILAGTIAGASSDIFQPYPMNSGNQDSWILDMDNNWYLTVLSEDMIELSYRYMTAGAEEALFPWLAFKLDARRVL